jgi:hypothetical protein
MSVKEYIKQNSVPLIAVSVFIIAWIIIEVCSPPEKGPAPVFTDKELKTINESDSVKWRIFEESLKVQGMDTIQLNDSQKIYFTVHIDTLTNGVKRKKSIPGF